MSHIEKIKPIKIKLRQSQERAIFHDTRSDMKILRETINVLIEKQNEVIDVVNKLVEANKKEE